MGNDGPPIERRAHPRTAVLKDGVIIAEGVSINCSVRNQHTHGAELRVDPGVDVPDRFVLHIHADDARYRAVVRWRKNERLSGLESCNSCLFLGNPGRSDFTTRWRSR